MSAGNDREKLISAITIILQYIGFPGIQNALGIINEICKWDDLMICTINSEISDFTDIKRV